VFARNRALTDLQDAQHPCALLLYAIILGKSIVFEKKSKIRHHKKEAKKKRNKKGPTYDGRANVPVD
jgi:hypothetical protein